MAREADHLIVGAGLAGLSLAAALHEAGGSVVVVDDVGVGAGASGAPIGLINPVAAKNANLSWKATQCLEAVKRLMDRAAVYAPTPFYQKTGVLRPAVDAAMLEAFRRNWDRGIYPEGWVRWLDRSDIEAMHPGLRHAGGGLWVEEAYTVDIPGYLEALAVMLEAHDVEIRIDGIAERHSAGDVATAKDGAQPAGAGTASAAPWDIRLTSGEHLLARNLYYATGSRILDDAWWGHLKVHPIKGQMALYRSDAPLNWGHAVAGRGYIAHLNGHDWVIGSTFEHTFSHLDPDLDGLAYLERKADAHLPGLREKSTFVRQWAGVRLGTANRLPIAEHHPDHANLWAVAGLGSKGLLYSAWLGERVAGAV